MPGRPHLAFPVLQIALIAAALAAGALAFNTGRNVIRHYQLQQEERSLRAELRDLDRDQEQLQAVQSYLQSDEYVEDVARRVLGLVRPGETLVVVDGTTPAAADATPEPRSAPHTPWWKDLFIAPAATPAPRAADSPF